MADEAVQDRPLLYERPGDVYGIATVVDRIMFDPRLDANPLVDEAHHRVPPAGFKYVVTEIVVDEAPPEIALSTDAAGQGLPA